MSSKAGLVNHGVVFSLLVILVLVSVGTSLLHFPTVANNVIVFSVAFIMAGLVVAQYMGLRLEGKLIVWIFIIPLVLFAILVVLLLPDVSHVPVEFLRHLL